MIDSTVCWQRVGEWAGAAQKREQKHEGAHCRDLGPWNGENGLP